RLALDFHPARPAGHLVWAHHAVLSRRSSPAGSVARTGGARLDRRGAGARAAEQTQRRPRKRNASAVSAPRAEAGGGALLDRSGELRIRFLAAVDHSAGFRGIYIEGHFAVGVAIRRGNDSDLVHGQVIGPPP